MTGTKNLNLNRLWAAHARYLTINKEVLPDTLAIRTTITHLEGAANDHLRPHGYMRSENTEALRAIEEIAESLSEHEVDLRDWIETPERIVHILKRRLDEKQQEHYRCADHEDWTKAQRKKQEQLIAAEMSGLTSAKYLVEDFIETLRRKAQP